MSDNVSYISEESKYVDNEYTTDNTVRLYKEDNKLNYPLIMLSSDAVELFRFEALKGMLKKSNFIGVEEGYNVYMQVKDQIVGVGILSNKFLKAVLTNRVFNSFTKKVYLDKETSFEGDMLYALCVADTAEA